ncbi:PD-(D/E)XK nuclease-like domain-containing protein [Mammaliicoccus vitulinus]|uniref:PD-(D/E)XK nuclease-like domain-containing protein n=1 Tax=Mammaliicoccus vitulinus TaxID=71237 RepID=UPI00248AD4A5|nr:PD-(D/E)XK nuclease-like domain-containing protein [Mammaliicoccus vitulinus]
MKKNLIKLDKNTYKTNHDYMSFTRFSRFLKCEAAMAANYHEPNSISQLVGSYVDAYFSNEMDEFIEEHPDMYTKTGKLKSEFENANSIIERIKNDEQFMYYMSGKKQEIMTGVIDDLPFKIKMDSYIEDKAIVDLKVMKNFSKVYSDLFRSYVNFVEAYDYDIEMAIFQEIVYQNTGKRLPCYLACVTKEDPADIGVFEIQQDALDKALKIVKNNIPRLKQILNGEVEPHRCNVCSYCRQTKKVEKALSYEYAGYNGDQLREEGIECNDPILKKE